VEVVYSKLVGSVCGDGFTDVAASVVCRSLGFTYVPHTLGSLYLCFSVITVASVWYEGAEMRDGKTQHEMNNVKNEGTQI